ncbi:hypothetical protein M413DRAFT_439064 [Hebeloma cylindrosporum]|uniref:Magnesium transport protein CorA n=1 Tax=Hebeloma cylindrosporum TaxID=76867 RepID=A0A0C2YBZ3_HEBCY|nr:hypothetical protein M413DRAFT_439064 [Hebeloma cylindrosporum h7]
MPRENSFSDSEGRSLTPDPEEEAFPVSPVASPANYTHVKVENTNQPSNLERIKTQSRRSLHSKLSKGNPASPTATAQQRPSRWAHLPPKEKFRAAVRTLMSMNRGTSMLLAGGGRVGAEPGVDPRRPAVDAAYRHIREDNCGIEIVDYSAVRSTTRTMKNAEFIDFMNTPTTDGLPPREPWVKVRWINIGGMDWEVIKAVSIRYNLHPLALEDVFHGHSQNRSKADYYTKHLFLRVLCHELVDDASQNGTTDHTQVTNTLRSASPEPMGDDIEAEESDELKDSELTQSGSPNFGSLKRRRLGGYPLLPTSRVDVKPVYRGNQTKMGTNLAKLISNESAIRAARTERKQDEAEIHALKKGSRVNVNVSPMFFFLLRDGTVISIRPTPSLAFAAPIAFRLKSRDTVLRKSADPSLLLHALLDLVVDKAVQVIDEYHVKIHKYERDILLRPKMDTVRQLHILSGDLILHKRTLDPIKTLVYGLRRYDVDRCAALVDTSDPANQGVKIVGFMSHKSKIYLADVFDHMEYILTSLDMFAGIAENLINYTFNVASYEMNEVMRRLTIATIIFLPLTVLTGYFGMNFESMWSVQKNSDFFFWKIAIPIMILVIPIALMGDLKKLWHYMQKKTATRKAVKDL